MFYFWARLVVSPYWQALCYARVNTYILVSRAEVKLIYSIFSFVFGWTFLAIYCIRQLGPASQVSCFNLVTKTWLTPPKKHAYWVRSQAYYSSNHSRGVHRTCRQDALLSPFHKNYPKDWYCFVVHHTCWSAMAEGLRDKQQEMAKEPVVDADKLAVDLPSSISIEFVYRITV